MEALSLNLHFCQCKYFLSSYQSMWLCRMRTGLLFCLQTQQFSSPNRSCSSGRVQAGYTIKNSPTSTAPRHRVSNNIILYCNILGIIVLREHSWLPDPSPHSIAKRCFSLYITCWMKLWVWPQMTSITYWKMICRIINRPCTLKLQLSP